MFQCDRQEIVTTLVLSTTGVRPGSDMFHRLRFGAFALVLVISKDVFKARLVEHIVILLPLDSMSPKQDTDPPVVGDDKDGQHSDGVRFRTRKS